MGGQPISDDEETQEYTVPPYPAGAGTGAAGTGAAGIGAAGGAGEASSRAWVSNHLGTAVPPIGAHFPPVAAPAPSAGVPTPPVAQPPPTTYWDAPRTADRVRPATHWAAPVYGNSVLVVMAGIVLLLFGLLAALAGVVGLAVGEVLDQLLRDAARQLDDSVRIGREAIRGVVVGASLVTLLIGVLHLLSALGIFLHRQSARFVGIALAALGTLLGVVGVMQTMPGRPIGDVDGSATVGLVIAVGYGFSLFALIAGGGHFRRRA